MGLVAFVGLPQNAGARDGYVAVNAASAVGLSLVENYDQMIHGSTVDDELVFMTLLPFGEDPANDVNLAPAVTVHDLDSSAYVADLDVPPGGWRFPFMLEIDADARRLYVWDGGGFPGPPPLVVQPTLYVYEYSGGKNDFSAAIVQTVDFRDPGAWVGGDGGAAAVGWAADIELLPDGRLTTFDSVFGSQWLLDPASGTFEMVVGPADPISIANPVNCVNGVYIPGLCEPDPSQFFFPLSMLPVPPQYTGTEIGGFPYNIGIQPGANYVAYRDGYVYFTQAAFQSIMRVPTWILDDPSLSPSDRAIFVEVVSTKPEYDPTCLPPAWTCSQEHLEGLEVLGGMTFNEYDPSDPYLYVAAPYETRLMRVDIETGERSTILSDPVLMNPIVAVDFVKPKEPGQLPRIIISSDQEHRLGPPINSAVPPGRYFTMPMRVSEILILPE